MTNISTINSAMGKSRSATMILAYLLWDSRRRSLAGPVPSATSDTAPIPPTVLDVPSALALLHECRLLAEPNKGFMEQLQLYHSMGCPDDVEAHPQYQRWLSRRSVQESLSVQCAPEVGDVRFEDEHLQDGEGDLTTTDLREGTPKPQDLELKCRKCRRLLTRGNFIVEHEPSDGKDAKACAHVFLHPLSWMKPVLAEGQLGGRLSCPNPKCGTNIGKFAWQGMRCSCGGWVTPAFAVTKGRVDEAVVSTREGTTNAEAGLGVAALRLPPGMKRGGENL
jgi:dual specificity phosphatase 12